MRANRCASLAAAVKLSVTRKSQASVACPLAWMKRASCSSTASLPAGASCS